MLSVVGRFGRRHPCAPAGLSTDAGFVVVACLVSTRGCGGVVRAARGCASFMLMSATPLSTLVGTGLREGVRNGFGIGAPLVTSVVRVIVNALALTRGLIAGLGLDTI